MTTTKKAKKPETALKWHGGKVYLAPDIIALMPKHVHYVEPYFGGGSVLLAKDPEGVSEVVNDINRDLSNFWRVLQREDAFDLFVRRLQATPFSEEEWKRSARRVMLDEIDVQLAVDFFIHCRQSMSGKFKSFAPLTRNRVRRKMNEQASAWWSAVDGLADIHARLGRVVILNRDALEVIRQQDGPEVLIYCDPPYVHSTRVGKGDDYEHEMTESQHVELLETLADIEGKFMLSGYDSPLYAEHADRNGWTVHRFDLPNNASSAKTKQRKIECVWCNF